MNRQIYNEPAQQANRKCQVFNKLFHAGGTRKAEENGYYDFTDATGLYFD
jgi:hypothetical protein